MADDDFTPLPTQPPNATAADDFTPIPHQYLSSPSLPVSPTPTGYGESSAAGLISGTMLGRAASAAVETGLEALPKSFQPSGLRVQSQPGESWGDLYGRTYADVGQRMRAGWAAHPYVATAASLLPSIVVGGAGGVARAIGTGAIYGATTSVNEADTLNDVPTDAVIGGVLGAIGGGGMHMLFPGQGAARQGLLDASQRLSDQGTPVSVPKYVASSGYLPQRLGQLYQSLPLVEGPIRHSTEKMVSQMGQAAETAGQGVTKQAAGEGIKGSVMDWIGPISGTEADQIYGAARQAINPSVLTTLDATRQNSGDIISRRISANLPDQSGAVNRVYNAISNPNGLTYSGIKDLRSDIGEMMKRSILPEGMKQSELKQLYGGLSTDLERSAYNGGGQQGLDAHLSATARYDQISDNRVRLTRVLGGSEALRSPEGVYGAMQKIASNGNSADIDLLRRVKGSTTPTSWDDLGRGMIANLGRKGDAPFSAASFLTDYGKISPAAKDEIFGASGSGSMLRQNLDDLQTLGQGLQKTKQWANVSGTGHVLAGLGAAEQAWEHRQELMEHPFTAIGALGGTYAVGKYLSSPAGSGALTNYVRQYLGFRMRPSPQTMSNLQAAAQRMSAVGAAQLGVGVLNPQKLVDATTSQ